MAACNDPCSIFFSVQYILYADSMFKVVDYIVTCCVYLDASGSRRVAELQRREGSDSDLFLHVERYERTVCTDAAS